jgi:hypothetical protein
MKAILDTARESMFIGPGRGSGGGSLVNYVLNITDIDPIKYNLLFARFLSEFREGYPDIDCLASNHFVRLKDGNAITLADLNEGDEIIGRDGSFKKVNYVLTRPSRSDESVYQILVNKIGTLGTIIASDLHKFILRDESVKVSKQLCVGDILLDGTRIDKIEFYNEPLTLTDIGVEDSLFEVIPFDVLSLVKNSEEFHICINTYIEGDMNDEEYKV